MSPIGAWKNTCFRFAAQVFYFFSVSRHRIRIYIVFVLIYYLYFSVILGLPLKLKLHCASILLFKYIVSIHNPRWFSHEREKELLKSLGNGHGDRPESCKVINSVAGSRKLLCLCFGIKYESPIDQLQIKILNELKLFSGLVTVLGIFQEQVQRGLWLISSKIWSLKVYAATLDFLHH